MRATTAVPAAIALAFLAGAATGEDKPDDDPVFRALSDELARAKTLSMPKLDKPYYVAGFANDRDSWSTSASFGALSDEGGGKSASTSTTVRVGSKDLDQTNFSDQFSFSWGGGFGGAAPVEPDYDALRQALWLDFDSTYKGATEAIAKKRAYLAANTVKDRPPDFGDATVTEVIEPRIKLVVDKAKWKGVVKRVSAVFRKYESLYEGSASMNAWTSHQYFVSSDPVRDRFGESIASFSMYCATQAPDGMPLSLSYTAQGRTEADLPDEATLVAAADELAKKLEALAKAPPAEDYTGPVLFVGRAADVFFLNAVGGPLSDPRQDLGDSRGGRLTDRLGRRIAARSLVVRDDPTVRDWKGKPLIGHFPVDDDGVLPQPITLLDAGVLKTYYMSRIPTKLIAKSNGHSRAGKGMVGNLFVEGKEAAPRAELEKKLVQMCAEEDLEYGMLVEDMGEGGGGRRRFFFGGGGGEGDLQLPAPNIAWKVFKDGHKELVRGATFKPAAYRVLKDISALGDDPDVLNTDFRGQRVSVVAPSVLVEELEMRRPEEEFTKPPHSPRPKFGD
jgi:predicted Zn-dependent protease